MNQFVRLAKALSDENRLRIILALTHGRLCVCQITTLLRLSPSTVSKHISILHQAGFLEKRKWGKWVYYRLSGRSAPAEVRQGVTWVKKSIAGSAVARADAKRLPAILQKQIEELCPDLTPDA